MKKSFEDLLEFIKNNASPDFLDLQNKAKQEEKTSKTLSLILCLIVDICVFFLIFKNLKHMGFSTLMMLVPILIIDFLIVILVSLFFSKNKKKFIASFKSNVILKLINNFYDNVFYHPNRQMPEQIYKSAQYHEYYNEYTSDDYMEGLLQNKYPVKMAEVHTVHEERHTDSDGHSHTTRTTVFHGLFGQIEMDKSINSELLIRQNHSISAKNRLNMDSEEFEKLFDVSATNNIIGMQLLTHDIMELLVSFKKLTGIKYDISIYNNIIYLRFLTGNMFEFKSFKKGAYDEEMLRKYYNVLDFTNTLSTMIIDLIQKTEI